MSIFMDLKGTSKDTFQIQKGGPKLKNESGKVAIKNPADSAYVDLLALILRATGDSIVINEDAALSGADWKATIARPTSGMTANTTFTLPPNGGTAGYFLQTDGAGNTSWQAVSSPSVTEKVTVDSTSFAFGASSPISLFTLPANAVVHKVEIVVDTAFDGAPTLEIGISGNTSKYMTTAQNDLTSGAGDQWEANPSNIPVGTTEALIGTYVAGGATVGAGRILVHYSIPT